MKKLPPAFALLFLFITSIGFAQNQAPVITNLGSWADDANKVLHVYFDVADNEGENLEIFLGVSTNDTVFLVDVSSATGDVGYPIEAGTNKEILWDYGTAHPNILNYKIRLTADDRYQIDIQALVDQVDTMNLYEDLSWMSGIRDHGAGFPHLLDVRDSILNRFNAFDFEVSTQAFSSAGGDNTGLNLIGRMPGVVEDHMTYISDAHYDGVATGPAADDNGSGVVGFLEVARILAPYNFRKSIRFIGFDMEETQPGSLGLIGSIKYVFTGGIPAWEEIKGVFNYEMIGYYSERPNSQQLPTGFDIIFPAAADSLAAHNGAGDFITNVGCDSAALWLMNQYDSITRVFVPELRIISISAPDLGAAVQDLRRSDHAPFWDVGIQAVQLTDGANFRNLNYHLSTDVMDSLNFEFMGNNVKAVIANLSVLAEIQHSDVAYVGVGTTPVGMETIAVDGPKLEIYPNPTKNQVLIKLDGKSTTKTYLMEITDEAGRSVMKQEVSLNGDGASLDVSTWKAGVYMVTVSGGEATMTKSLIVQ